MIKVKVNNEYKDIVKIFCGGTLQKEITKVWSREAQEYVYESSVEYTGSLPITITANGDALLDYWIYGADGGVGVATENLFDGEMESGYYDNNGEKQSSNNWIRCKNLISANSNTVYHAIIDNPEGVSGSVVFARCYDARGEFIGTASQTVIQYYEEYAFTTIDNTAFISFYVSEIYRNAKFAIYQTTISHKPYIPYGYKLPMTVSDGNTAQTVPVYIGENQLDSVEGVADYVDKASGKIVRRIKEYTFTGNEWFDAYGTGFYLYKMFPDANASGDIITTRFSHFSARWNCPISVLLNGVAFGDDCACFRSNTSDFLIRSTANFTTTEECKAYFKAQYDNGTPVKMWYIMNTPVEEDPPVPLPEIPTIDGTTVIDYDGDPKPSQMYVKYRR